MKKITSIFLTLICFISCCISTMAVECSDQNSICVYSPEFPDAYIMVNSSTNSTRAETNQQSIEATVFIEEIYDTDEAGNVYVVSSRLLSENEVLQLGVDSFDDISISSSNAIKKAATTRNQVGTRGALRITLNSLGASFPTQNGIEYYIQAHASWDMGSILDGENYPATGSDFMGITWGGSYSSDITSAVAIENLPQYPYPVFNMCEYDPNCGFVYEFKEYWQNSAIHHVYTYLTDIDLQVTLTKMNLESSNTTEVALTYIHTYESTIGTISLEGSSDKTVSASIELNNVAKQWSLVCYLSGFMY